MDVQVVKLDVCYEKGKCRVLGKQEGGTTLLVLGMQEKGF